MFLSLNSVKTGINASMKSWPNLVLKLYFGFSFFIKILLSLFDVSNMF